MKVSWHGFLAQNHSWGLVAQNISRNLIQKGHEMHLCSTNGYDNFPEDLKPYVKNKLDSNYDISLSYTALKNAVYCNHSTKNKFLIWNYETTVLPPGFAKYYKLVDKVLPSSQFSKMIFMENGIPESNLEVVPHGIDVEAFQTKTKYKLKTSKRCKILVNIAQPHMRKNIPGIFEAFGKAFINKDDVCLIVKVAPKKKLEMQFEVDFYKIYKNFCEKYKNHAEVEIITEFIPNIAEIYNACDALFSMSHCECWLLPASEAIASNKIAIAPRYGGQLDFMNDSNSLLIEGKIVRAPLQMQYWAASPRAAMFEPNIDSAVQILKQVYENTEILTKQFTDGMEQVRQKFTWSNSVDQILNLCQ